MSDYTVIKVSSDSTPTHTEINHNRNNLENEEHGEINNHVSPMSSYTTEIIPLANDGRVEIVASRAFGKQVTSSRDKDAVTIGFSYGEVVSITVVENEQHTGPDVLRTCGARIPHGAAVLDVLVSGLVFGYSVLLTYLLARIEKNWNYLSVLLIWFFYAILRINMYSKRYTKVLNLDRKFWHFTGISFGVIFMYATVMIVFPIMTRTAFYKQPATEQWDAESFIMPSLKVSVALALLGMAARRSFHCGKILQHADLIRSILLDNVDIFNLVETLGLQNGSVVTKGSALEVCILVMCELAFLVVVFEALVPYSLLTLDSKHVGVVQHKISVETSKKRVIAMVYPYSLLFLNTPFFVIRLVLFAKFNIFQLAYITKNVTSIIFGLITLIKTKNALKQQNVDQISMFPTQASQQRRLSI